MFSVILLPLTFAALRNIFLASSTRPSVNSHLIESGRQKNKNGNANVGTYNAKIVGRNDLKHHAIAAVNISPTGYKQLIMLPTRTRLPGPTNSTPKNVPERLM